MDLALLIDAIWETLHDLATGLGWVGLGVLGYFLFVAAFAWAWKRFWEVVHASDELGYRAEREAWEATEDFADALKCKGQVPHDRYYEKAGRSA
jgi:hypothetical protein